MAQLYSGRTLKNMQRNLSYLIRFYIKSKPNLQKIKMQEFKTVQKDEQEISYMLAGARKNGTIAALAMSFLSLLSVVFLFFANNLPQSTTQKTVGFKQIFSLIAVIISIYFYYKALKTISNLSGSNVLKSYQKFIASCIFIIALYTTLDFTQASKTTLYAIFALVIIVTVFGLTSV